MTKEFENLNLLLFYRWKRSYKFYGIVFALYLAFCLFALLMKGEQLGWVRYEVYFGSRPCLLLFLAALSVVIVYQVATLLYMQLALMLVLAGLMVLSFRNSMNRNQYGGR